MDHYVSGRMKNHETLACLSRLISPKCKDRCLSKRIRECCSAFYGILQKERRKMGISELNTVRYGTASASYLAK